MDFITGLRRLERALHQCAEAIRNREERKSHHDMPINQPIKVKAVISFDDKTVAETKAENDRLYKTQEGIRKATWGAVLAASGYALISALMWSSMRSANRIATTAIDAQTRPWLGVTDAKLGNIQRVQPDGTLVLHVSYNLKNFGGSPATKTFVEGQIRTGLHFLGDWQKFAPCSESDNNVEDRPGEVVFQHDQPTPKENDFISLPNDPLNGVHVLIMCIAYRDASLKHLHHTKVAFAENNLGTHVPQTGENDFPFAGLRLLGVEADD